MSSPHDALFKYVFSQPEHAASELRSVLPEAISKRLDWSSLELQPASFVDDRLSGRQADLLFTIRCEGREAYLYVLLEHQSTTDPLMAFRLLRYLVRIWAAFLVEHPDSERLPAGNSAYGSVLSPRRRGRRSSTPSPRASMSGRSGSLQGAASRRSSADRIGQALISGRFTLRMGFACLSRQADFARAGGTSGEMPSEVPGRQLRETRRGTS